MVSARVAPAPPFWSTPLFATLIIAVAGILAYGNALTTPFVFDDEPSILGNPSLHGFISAWSPPVNGGITVAGRPLLNLSFAINSAISGTNPWSYHVLNLLIHLAAAMTLGGIVRRTLSGGPRAAAATLDSGLPTAVRAHANEIALLAALLWAVHPLQTESVTYVVQRAESLMGLLFLLTLWCFIRACEPGAAPGWRIGAVAASLAGMATKEVMVVAPLITLLYDRTFVAGSFRGAWRERRGLHLALAATWLLLVALVLGTGGRGGTFDLSDPRAWWRYDLTQFVAVVRYLRLAIWPNPLVIDYGTFWINQPVAVAPHALVVISLLAATLVALVRWPALGFLGAWFFLGLAPSTLPPGTIQMIVEHRMYLPLAALTVGGTVALYASEGGRARAFAGVALLALMLTTVQRNRDYATAIGLFEQTVAQRPHNARAMALLADYDRRAGRLPQARAWLERSFALEPGAPEVLNNLGTVRQELGDYAGAVNCFEQALARDPSDATRMSNLGNALVLAGRVDQGIAQLEAALRIAPELTLTRMNLAQVHAQRARDLQARGQSTDAIGEWESAVKLQPGDAALRNSLGTALGRAGRVRDALGQFEEAVRLNPADESARQNAAKARQYLSAH